MKKMIIALQCLLLVSFCACGQKSQGEITTATNNPEKTTQETTVKTSTEVTTARMSEPFVSTVKNTTNKTDPYSDFLNADRVKYLSNPYALENSYYAFYDIDGNDTLELLEGWKTYSGIVLNAVFIIQNGVVMRQEALTGWMEEFDSQRLLFKNGTIRTSGYDENGTGYGYLRFEAGELKYQAGLSIESGKYIRVYTEGGYERVLITKEEYERVQKEMEGDGQVVELDWRPLAEWGQ